MATIRHMMALKDAKVLVHVFVTSCIIAMLYCEVCPRKSLEVCSWFILQHHGFCTAAVAVAPSYPSDLVRPYVPIGPLHSQGSGVLKVPKVKKTTYFYIMP